MRGRKPTHPNLKVITGTFRRDRVAAVAIGTAIDGQPDPPAWIMSERGRAEWRRLVAIMEPAGMLTAECLSALGVLCAVHGTIADHFAAGLPPQSALLAQYRGLMADFGLSGLKRLASVPRNNPFTHYGKHP